jgi:hypothetical protein
VITLSSAFDAGVFTVGLSSSGVFSDSGNFLDGDGNGVQGQDFSFTFNVLGGDTDQNGLVNFDDYARDFDTDYIIFNDIDGSLSSDESDRGLILARIGSSINP